MMNWKVFFVGCGLGVALVIGGFLLVSNLTTEGESSAPIVGQTPMRDDGRAQSSERQLPTPESTKETTKSVISIGQIVAAMNKASGTKFILDYEDGPFAVIEVNPGLWESLSPLEQKAVGTNFANLFGSTGGIRNRG